MFAGVGSQMSLTNHAVGESADVGVSRNMCENGKNFKFISPEEANAILLSLQRPTITVLRKESFTTTFRTFHVFCSA
jgi:hypothetical protein